MSNGILSLSLQQIARALGGDVSGNEVRAPGPGHSAKDRSLSVRIDANAPDGFLVCSHSPRDDQIACKDYVRQKVGLPEFKPNGGNWDSEPVPEREWAILNRVPLRQAGLFSGEGGTGTSILELTKDIAHVTGKDWLGSMPERGPAIYLGAEDDEKELHIRLAAITKHYGVTFEEF